MTRQDKITKDGEHLQFSIASSFQTVADLAERVSTVCSATMGSTQDSADMLRLCLAEALNNIVEHAYSGIDGNPIYADVCLRQCGYQVLLIDEGKPMPNGQIPQSSLDFDTDEVADLPEGGFGWLLILSEMDLVQYERRDGCNVLRLEKQFGT